jgi:cytochrome oxidase Cu insertion factor (SCO1/SenC/PrrC family)
MATTPSHATKRRTRPMLGAVAALALTSIALSACGSTTSATTGAAAHPAAAAARVAPLSVKTITGASLTIPTGKPAVVFFYSVNCASCIAGAKNAGAALAKAEPGVTVISVDIDPQESNKDIHQFMTTIGNPAFTLVRDDGTLQRRYNATALGTAVVLNGAGTEVFRGIDASSDQITKALAAAAA